MDTCLTSVARRHFYLGELKSGNQGKSRKKVRTISCRLLLLILPWKLVYAAISPMLTRNINFEAFSRCPSLLKGIVYQWPVRPSAFVCVRLFGRQFWKLYAISGEDLYALARMASDLGKSRVSAPTCRWKRNKLWLNKHAKSTMDSCDGWFSWRHISGFSWTCRTVAGRNGKSSIAPFSHEKQTSGNGI